MMLWKSFEAIFFFIPRKPCDLRLVTRDLREEQRPSNEQRDDTHKARQRDLALTPQTKALLKTQAKNQESVISY